MEFKNVVELPIDGSGCGHIRITANSVELLIEYEYYNEGKGHLVGGVKFSGLIAYRFRNEYHSMGFSSESYDSIAEARDSEWLQSLKDIEPSGIHGIEEHRHFAIFLSSNGYLEIIADAFEILPPRRGTLSNSNEQQ